MEAQAEDIQNCMGNRTGKQHIKSQSIFFINKDLDI